MEIKKEKAVLAGLSANSMKEDERSTEVSMEELAALVETAGGEVAAYLLQNKATPEARTFIGEGKVEEMKALIDSLGCDLAVFDNGDFMHLIRTQTSMFIFLFHKLILCGLIQNNFQPQTGIFQPQSININHKQSQTTIRYQSIFTPITTNKYRPWFVDEGRIYIYI